MKTLFKNGSYVNVFTTDVCKANILIEDDKIIGVGDYDDASADTVIDITGKIISPAFIDGHIHIESTMMTPYEFAKAVIPHGTTAVVADPHEIANVCGADGIRFMLEASKGLPVDFNFMLPSCVPSCQFDESKMPLHAADLKPFYNEPRVLGLAEMMNYVGVVFGDEDIKQKISDALEAGKVVDGHAPLLSGETLDKYISAHIESDHECSHLSEALEKLGKGQWILIREGTAAKNLGELIGLVNHKYEGRCVFATDDVEPSDLIHDGHIDYIVREAIELGADPCIAIKIASLNAATYFKLPFTGAIAPGYKADILVLDDLETIEISSVYKNGKAVYEDGKAIEFEKPAIDSELESRIRNTFNTDPLTAASFAVTGENGPTRVIETLPGSILTNCLMMDVDYTKNGGIDVSRDILKIAVIERHNHTGHIGVGFINRIGLKSGAIASSVSHDSHNLIVVGTNDNDMAVAANKIIEMGGGNAISENGVITHALPLPLAGLMSDDNCEDLAMECKETRNAVYKMGVPRNIAPFMNMAFISLPVIPHLKMTTFGLVDVDKFDFVRLQ